MEALKEKLLQEGKLEAERLFQKGIFEIGRGKVLDRDVLMFKHCPPALPDFYDDVFSRVNPSETFLVFEDERLTYGEALRIISRLRISLVSRFSLKPGDRVGLAMSNHMEWILGFIATTWQGGVAVPLNGWWRENELHYGYSDSQLKILICDVTRLRRSVFSVGKQKRKRLLRTIIAIQTASKRAEYEEVLKDERIIDFLRESTLNSLVTFEEAIDFAQLGRPRMSKVFDIRLYKTYFCTKGDSPPNATPHPDDEAAVFYTSGTTGFPKGVMLTHRGLCNQIHMGRAGHFVRSYVEGMGIALATKKPVPSPPSSFLPLPPFKTLPNLIPGGEKSTMLLVVPLFHVTGSHHVFLTSLSVGGTIVLMSRWDPRHALELVHREKVTGWSGVPTMIADVLEIRAKYPQYDLSSLKYVTGGGAKLPESLTKLSGKEFLQPAQGYGLTETNGAIASISGMVLAMNPRSTGAAFPIAEAKIMDPATHAFLPPNSEGELVCKSVLIMKGYLNKSEATKKSIIEIEGDPGWFRTGDLAKIDEEGFVYIMGRKKDIVIRGGENVSCLEVEGAVLHHPDVMECAVFPVPDDRLGERVAIAILPKPHSYLSGEMVAEFLKKKHELASFKIPTDYFFVSAALPSNSQWENLEKGDSERCFGKEEI